MSSFKPLSDNVLIRRTEAAKMTPGGIHIPDTARDHNRSFARLGEVISTGPGRTLDSGQRLEPQVRIGDRIAFNPRLEEEIEIDGEKYAIITEREILGILK